MSWKFQSSLLGSILIVTLVNYVSCEIYFKSGSPHVKLANSALVSGTVKFSRSGRPFCSFIGIPYATVPERFSEPQPVEPWKDEKKAELPGSLCPQKGFGLDQYFGEEDCLNLNVYVPMNNTGRKLYPVMVWVHGGGFAFGGGFGFGPNFFMDEDVILITFNYRLGVFGFLSTGDEIIPGNLGLKDQVAALRWVQENIKQFGGDPNKVTIFGESAGGAAVHYLMLSPTSKGLFQSAISQSGTALGPGYYAPNPRENAVALASHLNCPTVAPNPSEITSEEILTCLKGLQAYDLNKAQAEFKSSWPPKLHPYFFIPTKEIEPTATSKHTPFLTTSPWAILENKSEPLVEIPWIIGATEDEGAVLAALVLNDDALTNQLDSEWTTIAPKAFNYADYLPQDDQTSLSVTEKIRQFYFGDSRITKEARDTLSNLYSDVGLHSIFKAGVDTASRGKRNQVFLYQYAYHGPVSLMGVTFKLDKNDEALKKVGHADEIPMLFDFGISHVKPDTKDEEFSKNFVKLFSSFATHGELKHTWGNQTFRKWKAISRKELDGVYPVRWYRIEENPAFIDDPYKERIQFWEQLYQDHFKGVVTLNSLNVKDAVTKDNLAKSEL